MCSSENKWSEYWSLWSVTVCHRDTEMKSKKCRALVQCQHRSSITSTGATLTSSSSGFCTRLTHVFMMKQTFRLNHCFLFVQNPIWTRWHNLNPVSDKGELTHVSYHITWFQSILLICVVAFYFSFQGRECDWGGVHVSKPAAETPTGAICSLTVTWRHVFYQWRQSFCLDLSVCLLISGKVLY